MKEKSARKAIIANRQRETRESKSKSEIGRTRYGRPPNLIFNPLILHHLSLGKHRHMLRKRRRASVQTVHRLASMLVSMPGESVALSEPLVDVMNVTQWQSGPQLFSTIARNSRCPEIGGHHVA